MTVDFLLEITPVLYPFQNPSIIVKCTHNLSIIPMGIKFLSDSFDVIIFFLGGTIVKIRINTGEKLEHYD